MVYLTENKPKLKIKIDALDSENLNVDLNLVCQWSNNNRELY
jgi:hypothetical protein